LASRSANRSRSVSAFCLGLVFFGVGVMMGAVPVALMFAMAWPFMLFASRMARQKKHAKVRMETIAEKRVAVLFERNTRNPMH